MSNVIFVSGATGAQGGATVDALLAINKTNPASEQIKIHVLVRNPDSAAAQRLSQFAPQVEVFQGDYDSIETIQAAAQGCTAAFLVVSPSFTDPEEEARHGRNIIAACKATGTVKRLLYSSTGTMEAPEAVWTEYVAKKPQAFMSYYMISKRAIEEATTDAAADFLSEGSVILRPWVFYTNFVSPTSAMMYPELSKTQTITTGVKADMSLSCIDTADIGRLAARILTDTDFPSNWNGKVIPLGSCNLTMAQIVDKMNTAVSKLSAGTDSKKIKLNQLTEEETRARASAGDPWAEVWLFQNEWTGPLDIQKDVVDIVGQEMKWTTWEQFFEREKDRLESALV